MDTFDYKKYVAEGSLFKEPINESLKDLVSKATKIQSFVDKQGKEDGYEGGKHSPVGGVLNALKVAGGPGFDGDKELEAFYTKKLSKAIDTQLQKKYMKGFLNEEKVMEGDFGNDLESRYNYVRPLMVDLDDTARTEAMIDGMEDAMMEDDKENFDFYFIETMKMLGLEDELMDDDESFDDLEENDEFLDEILNKK